MSVDSEGGAMENFKKYYLNFIMACLFAMSEYFGSIDSLLIKESILLSKRLSEVSIIAGEKIEIFVDVKRENEVIETNDTLELNIDLKLDNPEVIEILSIPQHIHLVLGTSFSIWVKAKTVGIGALKIGVYSNDTNVQVRDHS